MFGSGQKPDVKSPSRSNGNGKLASNGNGKVATGGNGQVATNGNGGVKTLPKPAKLDEQLPVLSANGNGFPVAEKLPEHHRRFYIPLKLKLVFVALCSLRLGRLLLWLAIPWIDELGQSITVPLAAALIAGIAIIPGYLERAPDQLAVDRQGAAAALRRRLPGDHPDRRLLQRGGRDRGDTRLRLHPGLSGRARASWSPTTARPTRRVERAAALRRARRADHGPQLSARRQGQHAERTRSATSTRS